jgi:hypothetical protein
MRRRLAAVLLLLTLMIKPFLSQWALGDANLPMIVQDRTVPAASSSSTATSLAAHLTMPTEAAMALIRPVMIKVGVSTTTLDHHAVASALPELEQRIAEVLAPGLANLVIAGLHAYVRSVC